MTQEQQDAVWRALPEEIRKEMRTKFDETHQIRESLYEKGRDDATASLLMKLFGKHNLTASEEEKQIFSKGDKVIYVGCNKDWIGSRFVIDGDIYHNDYFKCLMASSISDGDTHIGNVPLSDLAPYTEEQEPKNDEYVDSAPSSFQNEIPSMSKEDAEELAKCLAAVDAFVKEYRGSQVDWLAYRMELAKDLAEKVIACSDEDTTITETVNIIMATVDGIVERLKGGEK